MASPQLEDGYTAVANEIIEALAKFYITGNEWRILCVVFRKTYGWKKRKDSISLTQFQHATNMPRSRVCEAIESLTKKSVIVRSSVLRTNTYEFNKNYSEWKPLDSTVERTQYGRAELGSTVERNKLVRSSVHTITNTKTNVTKESVAHSLKEFEEIYPKIDIEWEWESCQIHYETNGKNIINWRSAFRGWLRNEIPKKMISEKYDPSKYDFRTEAEKAKDKKYD